MSTALVPTQPHANGVMLAAPDLAERRRLLSDLIMRNGSEAQVDLVMHLCGHYGLDPLLKHLVLINGSAYITRDGLLHIAHQSGQFDGIEVALERLEDGEWAATCTVYRKDKSRPFRYTVYQKEHQQGGGGAWGKYPRAMLAKTAEVACLRRAFDVSLGAVEELGYDGHSPQSSIGQVVEIAEGELVQDRPPPAAPARPTRAALPAGKIETWDDDDLLTVCAGDYPAAQQRRAATVYFDRATDKGGLTARWKAAVRAGLSREIADPVAKSAAEALDEREPGAYQHHAREDGQPVLGDTPDERLAMLARIRAAMAAAGKTEAEVNTFCYATWKQPAIETLSAAEAEELVAILEARGDEDEGAPAAEPVQYADDGDEVPF
jgi:hypothetical protein